MNFNVAVIKGDGIGPEIVDQAVRVLDAAAESKSPVEIVKRNKQWKAISGGKSLIHGIIISFNAQMYNYY